MTDVPRSSPRFAICAGEHSGDLYAAHLIQQLQERFPNASIHGLAGAQSQKHGLIPWPNCQTHRIMGFTSLFKHRRHYKTLLQRVHGLLQQDRPDLLILIDYAGLNLRIAKFAHDLSIPVLYYIPPKVWAWGRSRLKKIQQYVTCVAPLYDFEHDFFKKEGLDSRLVQHPFLRQLPETSPTVTPYTVGLLPGSRTDEVRHLLPMMLMACHLLLQKNDAYRFRLLCAEPSLEPLVRQLLAPWQHKLPITLTVAQPITSLAACQSVMVCSGTATFECAMLCLPMVVLYRCHWLNYLIIKALVRLRWASLPNLMTQQPLVPELLQFSCRPENIAAEIHMLCQNTDHRTQQIHALTALRNTTMHLPHAKNIGQIASDILAPCLDSQ
jgi:lipid-A-disaccharide synthase